MEKEKYWFVKKWWFWAIIVAFLGICIIAGSTSKTERKIYNLEGEVLGEYGKEIVLNANTDAPAKKYLYKIPAGTYTVTTDNTKITAFYIVKDTITTEDSAYPEILNYVSEQYSLTNSSLQKNAEKEVTITINDDESINIIGKDKLKLVKK